MSVRGDGEDFRADPAGAVATPSVAFNQAMAAVWQRGEELHAKIRSLDYEGVVRAARSAVNLWLAGRVALRRLLARTRDLTPYGNVARSLLEERYMALLVLFEHAARMIEVPALIAVLQDLRGILASAIAEPLGGMLATD